MELNYCRVQSKKELKQILVLQKSNLWANLTAQERLKEGFVTVSHTLEILQRMNNACAHIIAKNGDLVVGYALCMHPKFAHEIELLIPMFNEIDGVIPMGEKYVAMGQICIDKKYRGSGIFRKLYETMKQAIQPEFNSIVTEVDAQNTRSLQAHYSIGFNDLKVYESGGQEWCLIRWE